MALKLILCNRSEHLNQFRSRDIKSNWVRLLNPSLALPSSTTSSLPFSRTEPANQQPNDEGYGKSAFSASFFLNIDIFHSGPHSRDDKSRRSAAVSPGDRSFCSINLVCFKINQFKMTKAAESLALDSFFYAFSSLFALSLAGNRRPKYI